MPVHGCGMYAVEFNPRLRGESFLKKKHSGMIRLWSGHAAFSLISKSACQMWCNRGLLPQGTAGGSKAKGITQPDHSVSHRGVVADEFLLY